jgi:leucyl aminopeptidase
VKVRLSERPLERCAADLLALAVRPADLRDGAVLRRLERACGRRLREHLARRRFTAGEGTALLLDGGRLGRHLALIGLGAESATRADAWRRAADQVVGRGREVKARSAALGFARPPADLGAAVEALAEGAGLAAYAFTEYRRDRERTPPATLMLAGMARRRDAALAAALRRATVLAGATNRARGWINLPAAVMTPTRFAAEAARAARAAGLRVRIDGPRQIAALGMGALAGVARGSAEEPRFIRVTYRPRGRARRRLALVGKGITFDSGGLSLKTADGMEHMKRDMAGGAAVLGAMLAIAALAPPVEVRAYVPASENMPGGAAIKPGDVLRAVSGRTIEVLNTDAEGRLVLADALAIAARDAPDAIVDVATLTGAVRSALGTRVGGIMGNDPALVAGLVAAGAAGGERLWELPLVPAYRADLESTVADLRNVAPDGHGGAIHAGLFLQEFVAGRPWAHLDVAGVAFTDRDLPCAPRGAVGFGVRLLARWVLAAAT